MTTNPGSFTPDAYDYYWTVPDGSDAAVVRDVITPGIEEAVEEFGVDMQELVWGDVPEPSARTPYVLAGPIEIVNEGLAGMRNGLAGETRNYLSRLASLPDVRLNLTTVYKAQGDRYAPLLLTGLLRRGASAWGIDIPATDRAVGANSIYTDTLLGSALVTNNAEDIADNIRCETFRLGYTDVRDTSTEALKALEQARAEAGPTIRVVADKIRGRQLWHRAPTDGAIFVKTARGWLASQTQSNKSVITPEQFSLIQGIDPANNRIVSTGDRPPSSDAPEFLAAFQAVDDDTKLAVHFHSNGITRLDRSPVMETHRTAETIRYGRFSSTDAVVSELNRTGDGWIILKEHGVLWTGHGSQDFTAFVESEPVMQAHRTVA